MQKLSHDKIEKLIELVRKQPMLYDKAHPNYKFTTTKQKTWQQISEKVDISEDNLQKAWKSLRDQFVRAKRDKKGSTGQAGGPKKSYKYFKSLLFLEDSLQPNQGQGTNELIPMELEELLNQNQIKSCSSPQSPQSSFDPLELSTSPFSSLPASPQPKMSSTSLKRKRCNVSESKEFFENLAKDKDDVSKFFSSAADTVRKCELNNKEWITFQIDLLSFIKDKLTEMHKL